MTPHPLSSLSPITILGAGISGLTLSRALSSHGIPSLIYEKNPSPANHNYGISLRPQTARQLIKVLGIDEGTLVRRVAIKTSSNGKVNGNGMLRAHRGRLESLLREGLERDVRWGCLLQGVEKQSGKGHALTFSSGEKVCASLVVDTTGVHSPIRTALLPDTKLNVLPYVVFRGTRRVDEVVWRESYGKWFAEGRSVLEINVGGARLCVEVNDFIPASSSSNSTSENGGEVEGVDISFIYSRPSTSHDELHRPNRTTDQASDISLAFYSELSRLNLNDLSQPFKNAFNIENVKKSRILHWLMRDVLVSKEECVRLGREGVVMLGDAAHALPVLGGCGACVAVGDAVELAAWLKEGKGESVDMDMDGFYGKVFGGWEEAVRMGEERLRDMHGGGKPSL